MMRPTRALPCLLLLASAALAGEPETGLFCPLAVEPNPGLTEPIEAMQKRFLSVARERSGYALLLRREVEDAIKSGGAANYPDSDVALARLAAQGKVLNAGYVSLKLTERNELLLQGRVVRADGKLVKASMLAMARGKEPLLDVLAVAAERFFDQLNGSAPQMTVSLAPIPAQPVVVTQPAAPTAGAPLRILGLVLGGVGAATAVTGVVVFAAAGSVQQDVSGNISSLDAPRVPALRAQQGAAVGLITAGAALGVTGIVMALIAPTAPVNAALAPRADGAMFVVEGSF